MDEEEDEDVIEGGTWIFERTEKGAAYLACPARHSMALFLCFSGVDETGILSFVNNIILSSTFSLLLKVMTELKTNYRTIRNNAISEGFVNYVYSPYSGDDAYDLLHMNNVYKFTQSGIDYINSESGILSKGLQGICPDLSQPFTFGDIGNYMQNRMYLRIAISFGFIADLGSPREIKQKNRPHFWAQDCSRFFIKGDRTLSEADAAIITQERGWRAALTLEGAMAETALYYMDAALDVILDTKTEYFQAYDPPATDRLQFPRLAWSGAEIVPAPLVGTFAEFTENITALSFGLIPNLMEGLPVVVAGGAVLAAMHRWPRLARRPERGGWKSKSLYLVGNALYEHGSKKTCLDAYNRRMTGLTAFMAGRGWEYGYVTHLRLHDDSLVDGTGHSSLKFVESRPSWKVLEVYLPIRDVAVLCLDYVNVYVSPIEVLSYYHPRARTLRSFRKTDIDLFLLAKDEREATETIEKIHQRIITVMNTTFQVKRTRNATTFVLPHPYRNIQVVHRLYQSVAQILVGFDLDCCALAYDGTAVLSLPRGARALQTRQNIVDPTRQSTTYEARLFKYARRGFAVAVPGINIVARMDAALPAITDYTGRSIASLVGANRLVAMFMVTDKTIHTRKSPCGKRNVITKALDIAGNISDYDGVLRKPDTDEGKSYTVSKYVSAALAPNHATGKAAEAVVFQTKLPHTQDRVDGSTLATGSFDPRWSDWYEGR